jgi:hypothetical protein
MFLSMDAQILQFSMIFNLKEHQPKPRVWGWQDCCQRRELQCMDSSCLIEQYENLVKANISWVYNLLQTLRDFF